MSRFDDFVGPCVHGRDPYTRCDKEDDPEYGGCGDLPARCAELLAIRAERDSLRSQVKTLREALRWTSSALEAGLVDGEFQETIAKARAALASSKETA